MAEISVNSVANNELDVEWEENYMSLTNVKEDLPRICKYDDQLFPGLKLYSQQPVLLYRCCRKRKGIARTIYRDPAGPYYEAGQTLQIPDDFEGKICEGHNTIIMWFWA